MSLLEVLVGAFVLAILTGSVYAVFLAGMRYHERVSTSLELQQTLLSARARVAAELSEASSSSLRVSTNPPGVVFGSARGDTGRLVFDAAGRLQWQRLVCFYLDDTTLLRKEQLLASPSSTPPVIPAARNTAYFRSQPSPQKTVGQDIADLSLSTGATLEIFIAAERMALGKQFRVETRTRVLPRN